MSKNRSPMPGDTGRPKACRTCNGEGGLRVPRQRMKDGKIKTEQVYEVCRVCRGTGNA